MDESDSDDSPHDADDVADEDNLYPLEGKFRDAKDRANIMGMTQLEREEILAEREEEQARKKRDMQLRSLLENKDREAEKSQKKRKAGAAELDDAQRKTIRPKTKRDEALQSYTRQREQAREDTRRRQQDRSFRRSRSNSSRRSVSPHSSQRGDSEEDFGRSKVRVPEPEVPAELSDFQRVRVSRDNFAKVCFYPTFQKSMVGCYARVCVGQEKPGVNTYRMARIESKNMPQLTKSICVLTSSRNHRRYSVQDGRASSRILHRHACQPRLR
jgi:RNA polymerase-associated protein RTF1